MFVMQDNILTFLSNEISEINNKIILIKDSDESSFKVVPMSRTIKKNGLENREFL